MRVYIDFKRGIAKKKQLAAVSECACSSIIWWLCYGNGTPNDFPFRKELSHKSQYKRRHCVLCVTVYFSQMKL